MDIINVNIFLSPKFLINNSFDVRQIKAQDQEIEEITDIEKQIFDSIEALEKLTVEGDEVVRIITQNMFYHIIRITLISLVFEIRN